MSISISRVSDVSELEILKNATAQFAHLHFAYNADTLDFLRKNFPLPKSYYLLAKDGEQLVGFCSLDTDWWEQNYFFLRELFVAMSYQRQGIGEALMKKCLTYAKNNGAIGVVTQTDFENIPMQKLCEKCGFARWDNPNWDKGVTYKLLF